MVIRNECKVQRCAINKTGRRDLSSRWSNSATEDILTRESGVLCPLFCRTLSVSLCHIKCQSNASLEWWCETGTLPHTFLYYFFPAPSSTALVLTLPRISCPSPLSLCLCFLWGASGTVEDDFGSQLASAESATREQHFRSQCCSHRKTISFDISARVLSSLSCLHTWLEHASHSTLWRKCACVYVQIHICTL